MFSDLAVPSFSRRADYLGPWAIDSIHGGNLLNLARGMNFEKHMAAHTPPRPLAMEKSMLPTGASVAIIRLEGLLMKGTSSLGGTSTIQVRRELRQAVADRDVAGILLAIDSPGGTVSGTDDLAREIRKANQAKPVWCQIEDLGCSAAYWAASQGARVAANSPTALVGSIGTYLTIYDTSGAAAKEGIRPIVFTTGHLKAIGVPGAPVTDPQIQHMQAMVNTVQESFDTAVLVGRKLSERELISVKTGGAWTATEAKAKRLVDAIQPLSATLRDFGQHLSGGGSAGIRADSKPPGGLPTLGRIPMLSDRPHPHVHLPAAFMADPRFPQLVEAGTLVTELQASTDPNDAHLLPRAQRIFQELTDEIAARVGREN